MENKILFSIIIPTYNRADFIKKSMESVLNQTYPYFELIVVDDGSTDNTEEVVKSIADTRVQYYKKKNEERGAARNYGFSKSSGDYIVFFDSDDLLYPHHLKSAYDLILKNAHPKWFHLGYEIKSDNNQLLKIENAIRINPNLDLIKGNFLSCNAVFLSADIAKKFPFNQDRNMAALEDWDLWLRIASKYKIILSDQITSSIINHTNRSVLITDKSKLEKRFEVFLNNILSNESITNFYRGHIHLLKCSCYTYISLHIALTKKDKKTAINYLLKGINSNPLFLFERRFLAIIKHLLT